MTLRLPAPLRRVVPWLLPLLVAACAGQRPAQERAAPAPAICPQCPACPAAITPAPAPPPATPLQAAAWSDLPRWRDDEHAQVWPALRQSCQTIVRQPRWQPVCEAAGRLGENPGNQAVREFFESQLQPWQVVNPDHSREGLITGYYEPLIKGSRTASSLYRWPIHGVPADLLTIDFGDLYPDLKNMRLRGRLEGNRVVPYWSRAELEEKQDAVPARVLLWAADPLDLFFLQVQGSGRVELPDGNRIRIGYADQNGHPYQSIGRWLVANGELPLESASMEGIRNWARSNPNRLAEMLNANPSYVFFRELPSSAGGPLGALGVPLTEGRSIAVDPRVVPLGAPAFLDTTWPKSDRPLSRLVMAQDTGGAIKGAVRADFFWGFGPESGALAGKMRQQGRIWVLLPRGAEPD